MKLLGKTVLVELNKPRARDSAIVLPDNLPVTTGIVEATVLNIGSGVTAKLTDEDISKLGFIKIGDIVLVNSQHGTPLKVDGKAVRLFNVEDILALIEK